MPGIVASEIRHVRRHSGTFAGGILVRGQRFICMKFDLRHEFPAGFHQKIVIELFFCLGQFVLLVFSLFFHFQPPCPVESVPFFYLRSKLTLFFILSSADIKNIFIK